MAQEKKRRSPLVIYLTAREKEKVAEIAATNGMAASSYCRMMLLKKIKEELE